MSEFVWLNIESKTLIIIGLLIWSGISYYLIYKKSSLSEKEKSKNG